MGGAASPANQAPPDGAGTPKEGPELQGLREAAQDFEKLTQDLADRGDTPAGAETARKYLDEYKRKIAKLQEESRIDRTDGVKDADVDPRLFELQNLSRSCEGI